MLQSKLKHGTILIGKQVFCGLSALNVAKVLCITIINSFINHAAFEDQKWREKMKDPFCAWPFSTPATIRSASISSCNIVCYYIGKHKYSFERRLTTKISIYIICDKKEGKGTEVDTLFYILLNNSFSPYFDEGQSERAQNFNTVESFMKIYLAISEDLTVRIDHTNELFWGEMSCIVLCDQGEKCVIF